VNVVNADARRTRFEAIAPALIEPLRRYLARRTDMATVDDVLSETLLVCWRRLDDLPDDYLPWAYGVARNCLANAERTGRRQERLVAATACAAGRTPRRAPPGRPTAHRRHRSPRRQRPHAARRRRTARAQATAEHPVAAELDSGTRRGDAVWRYLIANITAGEQRERWYIFTIGVAAMRLLERADWITPGGQHGDHDDKRQVHQHLAIGFLAELHRIKPGDVRLGDRGVLARGQPRQTRLVAQCGTPMGAATGRTRRAGHSEGQTQAQAWHA
jgi:DNA-directed RNA polymerase specialized sigma24 family protein